MPHTACWLQKWDINAPNGEAPEAAHIVVANNLSATAKDLPAAVAALFNQTLDYGFVILQVRCACLSCMGRPARLSSGLPQHVQPQLHLAWPGLRPGVHPDLIAASGCH